MTKTAIILAAGMGRGLKPLTYDIPKCLTEINGRTVLENTLEVLEKNSVKKAVIVIGNLGDQVINKFGNNYGSVEIEYIANKDYDKTGAVYSLWLAKKYLDQSSFIIECDTIFENEIFKKLNKTREDVSFWVGSKFFNKHSGCKLEVDKKDRIINLDIVENKNNQKSGYKSIGLLKISQAFGAKLIKCLDRHVVKNKEDYFGLAFKKLFHEEELFLLDVKNLRWSEIDTFDDIHEAESLFQSMKHVIMIPDGMADYPISELDNKTPLESAFTPNMDFLAREGKTGLVQTMYDGLPVGSLVAIMGLLGYNPTRYYPVGRASFEALAQNIHLGDNDIVFRCNLISIEDMKISDFTSKMISNQDALNIISNLKIKDENIEIYAGQSYRNLLVVRDANVSARDIIAHEPHSNINTPINEILLDSPNPELKNLIDRLNSILIDSIEQINELNEKFKTKADMIWLWSPSVPPKMPSFYSKFNMNGSVVAGLDFLRGLGEAARMESKEIRGATGYLDTNLKEKLKYAKNFLRNNDFLLVHYNATDEESHAKNLDNKIQAIESFDKEIVGPLLEHLKESYNGNFRIAIMPDHYTLVSNGQHLDIPVPYIFYGKGIQKDDVSSYSENKIKSNKAIKNYNLIETLKQQPESRL
jgi:2,3-bisphosphoglycerate-independent phosphoglycerate mutase